MSSLIFFVLLLTVCLAGAHERIYGGQRAPLGYLPHQVGLFNVIPGYPNLLCGGVILDSTHVLTAAHCAYNAAAKFYYNVPTANFRTGIDYSVPSVHFATKVSIHPSYIASDAEENRTDAAIFTVSPPFVFGTDVKPVTLPTLSAYETAGVTGTVSGYGLINATSTSSDLKFVNLTLIADTACNAGLIGNGLGPLPVNTFCAGGQVAGESFCTGDSGGGLVVRVGNEWNLIGTVRGIPICGTLGVPGLFTSYFRIRDWVMGELSGSANECFHEETIISYKGKAFTLQQLQGHLECRIPHIVSSSRGFVISTNCSLSVRLTAGHLLYTKNRGLVAASLLTVDVDILLAESSEPCLVTSLQPERFEQRFFGLNCLESTVYANGLKASTFEWYHTFPSWWMHVVGNFAGIHRASKLGDFFNSLLG